MKKVIYTVIVGKYDVVNKINDIDPSIDYICFTDEKFDGLVPSPWIHRIIENKSLKGKELNRFYKINVCDVLSEYDYSLYMDGNIELLKNPFDLYIEMLGESSIGMYDHYIRENVYQEAKACAELGLLYKWQVNAQINRYHDDGFISDRLYEANVIFRKHTVNLKKALNFWWNEYKSGVKRDQISFTYSMFKNGEFVFSLGKSDVRFSQYFFKIHHHKYSKFITIEKKLVAGINYIYNKVAG